MRFALPRLISFGRTRISQFSPLLGLSFRGVNHLRYASKLAAAVPLEQRTPEQLEEKKNNDLVASFLQFIDLVKDEPKKDQTEWIHDRFQRKDLQIPSRAKIVENVIHSLFERRLFAQAVAVYQHMLDDGLLPSPSTDALFLAMSLATSKAPGKIQLQGLKTILAYRSFTETHFIELLDHLVGLNIPSDTVTHLTRVFIDVKDDDYRPSQALVMKLVDIQTQAGDIVAAAEMIAEYDLKEGDHPADPYARMIKSAPADDQAAVDWIMGVMREKDVPINIMVFNAILARQSQARDLRKAFAFYGVLFYLAETTPLRPNAITYKHLFRLLGYQYKTNYKPNNSRRKEPPGAITPPRQLFTEMMSLWFSTKFHPPASDSAFERQGQIDEDQGLLTVVFRTFLYLDDYAGALVVLRTISDLGLEINERTYFIVLRYMARRVYYDVHWARRQARQPFFAFELMGPFDAQKLDGDPDDVYEWIMDGLLKHNRDKGKDDAGSGVPRASWRGRIPTVAEVLQQERHLSGGRVDRYPIVLMLQRALQMRPSVNGLPWGDMWREKTVQKAQGEMIPENMEFWAWPKAKAEQKKI